jgi:hypothetical protein
MIKIKTWFSENRIPSIFAGIFLLISGGAGWFAYSSWDDYGLALQSYLSATEQLGRYAKQTPPPDEGSRIKLGKALEAEQAALNQLLGDLRRYRIPAFAGVEKAKSQDAPQLLQDALRAEVTKIKSLANANKAILPQGFYLALEEYENRLPSPEEAIPLAKQLTVFDWICSNLVTHQGLAIADFSRLNPAPLTTAKTDRTPATPSGGLKSDPPYELLATLKIALVCDQGSLREILNSFSQSPYFLMIDSLQLQNTVTEPPRRDIAAQLPPPSNPVQDGQPAVQRIPVVLGQEKINLSFRVRILQFPDRPLKRPNTAK